MAKLNARGRTELARFSREQTDLTPLVDWQRTTIAVMSDGRVLRKVDVRFRSDGSKHSYGWKQYRKLKDDSTTTPAELAAGMTANALRDGWVVG